MQTFYMLGRYSGNAVKHISAARTEECSRVIEALGGEIILIDALLGDFDLALIVKFKTNVEAMRASLKMQRETGIAFTTYPAVSVEEFDRFPHSN